MLVKRSSMLPRNGLLLSDLSQMSVRELALLARSGQREAFDPLYRRFSDRLVVWALRRTGDRMLAEDVASETWATALGSIGSWEDNGSEDGFARWLFGVAHGALCRLTVGRWREVCSDDAGMWENAAPLAVSDDAAQPAGKEAMVSALHEAIGTLSAFEQTVVRMRLDGQGQSEIARELGRTPKQVDSAWTTAQRRLRRQLAESVDVENCSEVERATLRELAAALNPSMREVAQLRLDGLSPAEVAARVGMSAAMERQAWRRAKDVLSRQLADPAAAARALPPVASFPLSSARRCGPL
ncbi:sigma-70 family RNA polymerase sigma factor [Micromonospora sp. Llam7]|uniref:RNA polymerase sigma factor n=1 Tax=Micromonospora tarapacensis TaxID=2835305 RepID=UPI001C8402AE|nr:sigma-70 family RNA polymerase sigma factor [Micromonospora tarapacensis]MBX7269772.1 sigma-70 family RNA polymerase sigma factor [Micromonospora tarapacensis]